MKVFSFWIESVHKLLSLLREYYHNPSTILLYSFVVTEGSEWCSIPFYWNYQANRIEYVKEKWKLVAWKCIILTQWTMAIIHVGRFRYTFFEANTTITDTAIAALYALVHLVVAFYSINTIVTGKDMVYFINSVLQFDTQWTDITSAEHLKSCSKASDSFLIMILLAKFVLTPLIQVVYWSNPCRASYPVNNFLFGSSCESVSKFAFVPGAVFEWYSSAGSITLYSFYITTLYITGQRPLFRLSQIRFRHVIKDLLRKDRSALARLYRMISIVQNFQEYCFRYIVNPIALTYLYCTLVLTSYCTMTLYEKLPFTAYLLFPILCIGSAIVLYCTVETFARIHHVSQNFLGNWESQLGPRDIWQRKFVKSCRPLRVMNQNSQIRKGTTLDYFNKAFNDITSLLIST